MTRRALSHIICHITVILSLVSCSMTKNIPEGEQLFTGLTKISYEDEPADDERYASHLSTMKEEVEAALATQPNGSLFGSSYYTVPWSWHLWVYNKYSGKTSGFAKWMTKSFGRPPVLMSQVNPALRASVAQSVLRNNGYFRGYVDYEIVPQRNPKKSKIGYTIHLDSLFTLDSVSFMRFTPEMNRFIDSTRQESLIRRDAPFSIASLDGERTRISSLLRNNGYYFYNPNYASYLADTFAVGNKAQLRFIMADGLPPEALHKWYIGRIGVQFRRSQREQLTDSIRHRNLTIQYSGKRSPIRPGVILRNLELRPRQEFNYDRYVESNNKINATGVFSRTDFQFTPRPGTDTLDLQLNCVFDKPYDFYIEGTGIGRTNGRYGPEAKIGFTKRNLFRGAEKLDINLHGAYQWQSNSGTRMSTYQYGADVAIEFPRIIAPFYNSDRVRRRRDGRPRIRRFFAPPTTYAKVSVDIVRRPEYYKMRVVSGEWVYRWQTSESSRHEFSPLTVKYQFKNSTTEKYDSVVSVNPYLMRAMEDYFIPKMRYTYVYTSPASSRSPIRWETTFEESGNLVSLFDRLRGKPFSQKGKKLFNTEYSQFLRLETDFSKTWSIGASSRLVAHLNGGILWNYGNNEETPFSETFYAGGPNSIRAFSVRGVGPGAFDDLEINQRQFNYLLRNGDLKLIGNLEYRARLFGNLHGAVFLDAGNVWNLSSFDVTQEMLEQVTTEEELFMLALVKTWADQSQFTASRFFNDIALGTGIGLRYDLGFLVLRLDWGIALHCPWDTGKSGYFNIPRLKGFNNLNFAIGYPF